MQIFKLRRCEYLKEIAERERETEGELECARASTIYIYICLIPLTQIHGRPLSWLDTDT